MLKKILAQAHVSADKWLGIEENTTDSKADARDSGDQPDDG